MFDYFRSGYDLGEEFTNKQCQTKDFDPCLGGSMSNYWLDPHGYLYLADYTGTHEFIEIKEGDPGYNEKIAFLNFKYLPNGKNGRMKPCLHTGYVRIYPSEWNKGYDSWPELGIFFKYGRLVDYEEIQPDRL